MDNKNNDDVFDMIALSELLAGELMDDKNSKDAFASLDFDIGEDKYLKKHQGAVRLERASELDKRISDFDKLNHDLAWAKQAEAFCKREENANKDLADISKCYKDLSRIREEAKDIIKADEERRLKEKEQAKIKAKMDMISEYDKRISDFDKQKRTIDWANQAEAFCDREEKIGREFADQSKMYKSLSRIRSEALDLIKADEKRKANEKEQAKIKAKMDMINEYDKRISDFDKQKRTIDWANQAEGFCDREEKAGKEFAELSKMYKELSRIRGEAIDIIKAENKRKQSEQEELRLMQQEMELKSKAEEDAVVKNLQDLIDEVSSAERDSKWLSDVERATLLSKGLSPKVFSRVNNRLVLDRLNKEVPDVSKALSLDEQIRVLGSTRQKNKSWAKKVFDLESEFNPKYDKYMSNKSQFYEILSVATNVYYGEDLTDVEDFIKKVEADDSDGIIAEFKNKETKVKTLKDAIYLNEYISNFDKRWADVKKKIATMIAENEKVEQHNKKVAEENAKALALKKAKHEKHVARRKAGLKFLGQVAELILELGVVAGIVLLSILYFDKPWGMWIVCGGGALAFSFFWLRYFKNRIVLHIYGLASLGACITGMIIPSMRLFLFTFIGSYLLLCIYSWVKCANKFNNVGVIFAKIGIAVSVVAVATSVVLMFWTEISGFIVNIWNPNMTKWIICGAIAIIFPLLLCFVFKSRVLQHLYGLATVILSIVGMAMPSMRLCFLLPVVSYLVLCIVYLVRAVRRSRRRSGNEVIIKNIIGISVSALAILINVIIIFWSGISGFFASTWGAIYGFFAGIGGVYTALIWGGLILIVSIVFKVLQVCLDWDDVGVIIYTIVQLVMFVGSFAFIFFGSWGFFLMSAFLYVSALVIGYWEVDGYYEVSWIITATGLTMGLGWLLLGLIIAAV